MRWLIVVTVLGVSLLVSCSEPDPMRKSDRESELRIRWQLAEFLPKAIHESVRGMGSTRERWEGDWATRELLTMIEGENRRSDAFSEGLERDKDPLVLKPPTPRSWWLPVPAEGTWTFEINRVDVLDEVRATATVDFIMDYNGTSYPEPPVTYRMRLEDERWRIDDIVHGERGEYSLRGFLTRSNYMTAWPEDGAP